MVGPPAPWPAIDAPDESETRRSLRFGQIGLTWRRSTSGIARTFERWRSARARVRTPASARRTLIYTQAFAWRNWQLLRRGGRVGARPTAGRTSQVRRSLNGGEPFLASGSFADVCVPREQSAMGLLEVHPQYTIGLTVVCIEAGDQRRSLALVRSHNETDFLAGAGDLAEVPAR